MSFLFTSKMERAVRRSAPSSTSMASVYDYVDRGSDPPIVMIRGLAGNLRNYTYALVDRLTNGFRVIAVDRPAQATLREAANPSVTNRAIRNHRAVYPNSRPRTPTRPRSLARRGRFARARPQPPGERRTYADRAAHSSPPSSSEGIPRPRHPFADGRALVQTPSQRRSR